MTAKLTTIDAWLQFASQTLKIAGSTSYHLDALILLEYVIKKPREYIFTNKTEALNNQETSQLERLMKRRLNREPIAYIIGNKEFYGRNFTVTKDVLIPRPESEDFITIMTEMDILSGINIIDVGCGSGAIGITLALEIAEANITLTDTSDEALTITKLNASNLNANLTIKKNNLLDSMSGDIICANLPYLPPAMTVAPELTFEPKEALFAQQDGLSLYRKMWNQVQAAPFVLTESLQWQHQIMREIANIHGYQQCKKSGLVQCFRPN